MHKMESNHKTDQDVKLPSFTPNAVEMVIFRALNKISEEILRESESLGSASVYPSNQVYIVCGGYPRNKVIF